MAFVKNVLTTFLMDNLDFSEDKVDGREMF